MSAKDEQRTKLGSQKGFIAALDQSGGSTPKALGLYGIGEDAWSDDDGMFALIHEMRTRIVTSPAFTGERVLAAILFDSHISNAKYTRVTLAIRFFAVSALFALLYLIAVQL